MNEHVDVVIHAELVNEEKSLCRIVWLKINGLIRDPIFYYYLKELPFYVYRFKNKQNYINYLLSSVNEKNEFNVLLTLKNIWHDVYDPDIFYIRMFIFFKEEITIIRNLSVIPKIKQAIVDNKKCLAQMPIEELLKITPSEELQNIFSVMENKVSQNIILIERVHTSLLYKNQKVLL